MKPRLAASRKGPGRPQSIAAHEATRARCAGIDRSTCRARISFRLQKLTSGARSRRPRVNSPSPPPGSSSTLREQTRRAKERRKPARGGKAVRTVAGSPRESVKGSTCRWKAPRIGEAALVDARAVEAVLALRTRPAMGLCGARQGASEAGSPALARPITPRQGSPACARGSSPPLD